MWLFKCTYGRNKLEMVKVCLLNKQVEYSTQTAVLVRETFAISLFPHLSTNVVCVLFAAKPTLALPP